MRERSGSEIRELVADIETELDRLARLDTEMRRVEDEIERAPARVGALAARQPAVWLRAESEIRQFAAWLRELAARLSS
jgi:hypothetical protein